MKECEVAEGKMAKRNNRRRWRWKKGGSIGKKEIEEGRRGKQGAGGAKAAMQCSGSARNLSEVQQARVEIHSDGLSLHVMH